jgi:hypothetical protein
MKLTYQELKELLKKEKPFVVLEESFETDIKRLIKALQKMDYSNSANAMTEERQFMFDLHQLILEHKNIINKLQ